MIDVKDPGEFPAEPVASSPPRRWGGTLRIVLALVLTDSVLLYCWVMLFVSSLGIPMKMHWSRFALGLGLGIVITWALSGRNQSSPKIRRRVLASVLMLWMVGVSAAIWMNSSSLIPVGALIGWIVPGSLWVPWLAWFCWPLFSIRVRALGLLLLLFWGGLLPWTLKVEGLTGDAKVNFVFQRWRSEPVPRVPQTPAATTSNSKVLLRVSATDFPEFLGNRQGRLTLPVLDPDWKKHPPQEKWRRSVGLGWSSFAIVGDFAFTQEQREAEEWVVCYELQTGDERWWHSTAVRFDSVLGGAGPRATPTVADGEVYAVGGTGVLHCLNAVSGTVRWTVDLMKETGGSSIHHGVCGSPLILNDLVIVSVTGKSGISPVAYDRKRGVRRWSSGSWPASYSSPMLANLGGVKQILMFNSEGVEACTPSDGHALWKFAWTNDTHTIPSQPVLIPGNDRLVLLSIAYGKGSVLLEVQAPGENRADWSVQERWRSRDMKTKFTTAVVSGDSIFGLDDGILACVNLKDGKRRWKQGRYQHGQLLLVGDLLIVQAESGEVVLVEANPDRHVELGRISALHGKTWNYPALAGKYLLVRNDREAACYELPTLTHPSSR